MLDLSFKEIALLFHDDMQRGVPGEFIAWCVQEELVPYDAFIDGNWPDEAECLEGLIWLN